MLQFLIPPHYKTIRQIEFLKENPQLWDQSLPEIVQIMRKQGLFSVKTGKTHAMHVIYGLLRDIRKPSLEASTAFCLPFCSMFIK